MHEQGPAAIAKALGCSRMQVYRVLGEGNTGHLRGGAADRSAEEAQGTPGSVM